MVEKEGEGWFFFLVKTKGTPVSIQVQSLRKKKRKVWEGRVAECVRREFGRGGGCGRGLERATKEGRGKLGFVILSHWGSLEGGELPGEGLRRKEKIETWGQKRILSRFGKEVARWLGRGRWN